MPMRRAAAAHVAVFVVPAVVLGCAEERAVTVPPRVAVAAPMPEPVGVVEAPLERVPFVAPVAVPTAEATAFPKLQPDFVACYKRGRRAAPAMADGRVTLQASVDAQGKVSCAVPADARGLTGEVADCLAERLGREALPPGSGPTLAMTVLFTGGEARLEKSAARRAVLDEVDTRGIDDAGDIIRGLVPDLASCVRQGGSTRGSAVLYVRGRVGRSGEVTCTVATSTQPLPDEVRACAADRLRHAKFAPPRTGKGVVSIPVTIVGPR